MYKIKENLLSLYSELKKNKDTTQKLSFALTEVFYNLWKVLSQKEYAPKNFKEVISEMNPLFKGIAANDPKDLILFLLETIHKELNEADKNSKTDLPINFNNFMAVYGASVYNFESKNKSIIFDEFYFYSNSMTTCSNCRNTIHNVQMNSLIFFPLEEVRKFMNYNFNQVRINDCFEYYERNEVLPSFYCNICKASYESYNQSKLVKAPKTLIINLNRGIGLQFNVGIIFEEYLNLRKYIYNQDSPYYYELIGVASHFGSNDDGGHFIAFCKNCNDCNWYKFNDGMVTKCSFQDVCSVGLPYVLFYSYVKA